MLTSFNNTNDMNILASNTINSYIQDGYRIDAKESAIDSEKNKNCTFKAVLKKDVDGVLCKTIITLHESDSFSSISNLKFKTYTYHKLDLVDGLVWDEESRTFSSSHRSASINNASNKKDNDSAGKIILNVNGKQYEVNDLRDGQIKLDWVNNRNDRATNKSGFNKLSDVIKLVDNNCSKDTCEKCCDNKVKSDSYKTNDDCDLISNDDLEDSLSKLVSYIFGK
jgi:hypothetical protein